MNRILSASDIEALLDSLGDSMGEIVIDSSRDSRVEVFELCPRDVDMDDLCCLNEEGVVGRNYGVGRNCYDEVGLRGNGLGSGVRGLSLGFDYFSRG